MEKKEVNMMYLENLEKDLGLFCKQVFRDITVFTRIADGIIYGKLSCDRNDKEVLFRVCWAKVQRTKGDPSLRNLVWIRIGVRAFLDPILIQDNSRAILGFLYTYVM